MINRHFKQILVILIVLSTNFHNIISQTHYYIIPPQTYTRKGCDNIEYPCYYDYLAKDAEISMDEIKISELITLKEYKKFLYDVKDTSTEEGYTKLLPVASCFTKELYDRYLNTGEFDDYPVVAVTWYAAMQYCKWKTLLENEPGSLNIMYRLPTQLEWEASSHFFNQLDAPHDFGKYFSDWIYNPYIEVDYVSGPDEGVYQLDQKYNLPDNTGKNHRRIMGTSYHSQPQFMNDVGRYQFYNNALPYLSFRCVIDDVRLIQKVYRFEFNGSSGQNNKDHENEYEEKMEVLIIKYWGLENYFLAENEASPAEKKDDEKPYDTELKDFYTWRYYTTKDDNEVSSQIRMTGEYCGGEKCGDWFFFTKDGKLKKHYYYTDDGKKQAITSPIEYKNIPDVDEIISRGFYFYANELKKGQKKENQVVNNKNMSYEVKDGRFNGYFVYDKNNVQIAGRYKDNVKTGIWAVWDGSNKLVMVRDYTLGHEYKNVYKSTPQNALTLLLDNPSYILQRNDDGYCEYYNQVEKDVLWSKTIYRSLKEDQNPLLFNNYSLMDIILEGVKKGGFPVFEIHEYHDFGDSMAIADVLASFNPEEQEISSYTIKEINVLDIERIEMECRPIGFCPVVKDKKTGKEKELFWVYLPSVRKSFAQIPLQGDNIPSHIHNLDDLFFFRYYGGSIIGESNVYNNRRLSEYVVGKELELEAQRIENQLIDFEYETWGYFMGIDIAH